MDFENTPKEMAEKLLEFNRDFSDDEEEFKNLTVGKRLRAPSVCTWL